MKRSPTAWTVQYFPEGSGEVRSVRVPRGSALAFASLASAGVALCLAWAFGFLGQRHSVAELERLERENRVLADGLAAAEARTQRLARTLDNLEARDQRYRLLAGLPLLDPDIYDVGVGGPALGAGLEPVDASPRPEVAAGSRAVMADLDHLVRRAELLAASLSEAADSMDAQRDVIRHRPSIYPVLNEEAWISSGFSFSRLHPLLGYRRPHPGIDISAPAGSPVVATAAGRVVFAGREQGYGRLVEVDHGYGYRTRYAHLGRVTVRPGQRVERGATLGEVGHSGLTTGPNLHYEVVVDGRPVNPWGFLLERTSPLRR